MFWRAIPPQAPQQKMLRQSWTWSGTKEMLREAFLQCERLRWVHSRWAGLDNLLFPELVNSDVVLTNGKGVFSPSLGEFALTAILYFARMSRACAATSRRATGLRLMWK